MSSLLQSTRNTRALPTGTMRYIRSDAPENLTEREVQWLLDNNIITIVDLWSEEEIVKKPCFLKEKTDLGIFIFQLQVAVIFQSRLNICILFIDRW